MKHLIALRELIDLLITGKYELRTLDENKQLFRSLEEFEGIVFDKKQMYGDPNYHETPLEHDLVACKAKLQKTLKYQFDSLMDLPKLTPEQLMQLEGDYGTFCRCGCDKVWHSQSRVRQELLRRAEAASDRKEKEAWASFILHRSNSGNTEYFGARQLLEEMGVLQPIIDSW